MIVYVDSSVVLRWVLAQPDGLELPPIDEAYTSALTEVECLRTLDRRRVRLGLSDIEIAPHYATARRVLAPMHMVQVTRGVLRRASDPFPTSLRTLDAIHLATALALSRREQELVVATHDAEMALAARAAGLDVLGA